MQMTFHDLPTDDIRLMLGENAIRVFGLDGVALNKVAERIGPRPEDLDGVPREIPTYRGYAFRERGLFS
jgi:hypothetical protein